jgi:hypothetical protein
VKTEMIAGYKDVRGVRDIEPEDVAAAIVEALRFPRVDVFVPKVIGPIWRIVNLLPRGLREAILRAMKVDQATWQADLSQRTAYEARAAASEPGLEERPKAKAAD